MALPYKLVCELPGHDADVRAVCVLESGVICSGSRDASVRVWVAADGNTFKQDKALYGHEHWVASLLPLPRSELHPRGSVVSGGHDKKIIVWDIEKAAAALVLDGHTNTVSSLSLASNGDIVSGSWDQTVRVWRNGKCIHVLQGHEAAIWAVLAVPGTNLIISDKTIRIWNDGKLEKVVRGHTDAVRALVNVPGLGFASASNDTTIRLWSLNGLQLQEMHGHAEFIYTLAINVPDMQDSLSDMLLVSGGEERAVKVWKNNESIQTIAHPAVVWSVAVAPHTGEIVSGCSDHVIRVWSQIPSRQAPLDIQNNYTEKIQLQAIPQPSAGGGAGGVDLKTLPGPDWLLANTGKRDGENKIIREGETASVYMWSATNEKWEKIGTVVDKPQGGGGGGTLGKQMLHGKEYDYVFTVDVDDGVTHKLGYNRGENPYDVAQQFIYDNDLSQGMLDRIAQFIDENAGGNQAPSNYLDAPMIDPFSGAPIGVYPSDRKAAAHPSVAPAVQHKPAAAASHAPAAAAPKAASLTPEPNRAFLSFADTAQLDPILKKLEEFSGLLSQAAPTKDLALNQAETDRLRDLVKLIKETNRYHASQLYDGDLHLILKLLSWPPQRVFPALDLLRFLWLHPQAADFLLRPQLLAAAQSNVPAIVLATLKPTAEPFVKITALRNYVNMFTLPAARDTLLKHTEQLLDVLPDLVKDQNKLVRFAAVTVLLNFSAHFLSKPNPEKKIQCMSMLCEQLPAESDPETAFRALMAVYALMWHDESVKNLAGDLELKAGVERITAAIALPKVKEAAASVLALLK